MCELPGSANRARMGGGTSWQPAPWSRLGTGHDPGGPSRSPETLSGAPAWPGWSAGSGRPWWLLLVALPFYGLTTWLAFAILAYRRRSPRLAAWAWGYGLLAAVAILLTQGGAPGAGMVVLTLMLVAGCLHLALAIQHAPAAEVWGSDPELVAARRRMQRRQGAKEIARREPALAREAGMGLPGSGWGVLDLNHASASEMAACLGIGAQEAARVADARAAVGKFTSIAEVVVLADLSATAEEAVGERAILL